MLKLRKLSTLALVLALLLAAMTCAAAEDDGWNAGPRRLRLGNTYYSVQVDAAFERRVHPEDPSFLRAIRSTLFMMR